MGDQHKPLLLNPQPRQGAEAENLLRQAITQAPPGGCGQGQPEVGAAEGHAALHLEGVLQFQALAPQQGPHPHPDQAAGQLHPVEAQVPVHHPTSPQPHPLQATPHQLGRRPLQLNLKPLDRGALPA